MNRFDFGTVKISENEIEELAIATWCEHNSEQPSAAMTEVFEHDGELFVHLANCNGPLETSRVVAVGNKVFLQELDDEELSDVESARLVAN